MIGNWEVMNVVFVIVWIIFYKYYIFGIENVEVLKDIKV